MKIERRDFFKTATAGFALALRNQEMRVGQVSGKANEELQAGCGTLYLEGKLRLGSLKLEAQDFLDRKDHSVIVRSTWESTVQGKLESTELYSAMFSYQDDLSVFALCHDHDHSTIVVLSDTDDARIGSAVVWNDGDTPQILSFEKAKLLATDRPHTIHDVNGKVPDWIGKRKPPDFTWMELETVFGTSSELQAFMRGRRSTHPRSDPREWMCFMTSDIPGCTLSSMWRP